MLIRVNIANFDPNLSL